jgi:hypothetical protein
MLERFERPIKIICLAMAALLAWQLGNLILRGDPLAHLKIPALPALPGATNETPKVAPKETNAAVVNKTGTNGTNTTIGAIAANGTNAVAGTNAMAKSTNALAVSQPVQTNASSDAKHGGSRKSGLPEGMPGLPGGMSPEMMAQMMGGGMPGGRMGGGMKKVELSPEIQSRVDRIVDSEFFGPVIRPMPMALIGIAEEEAFIQATNGQTGPIKLGGEMAGIKLLRIGVNRVLVEQDGEKKELTIFGGAGGESLMPSPTNAASTNMTPTNLPSTNAPTKRLSIRNAATNASTSPTLASKQKETPSCKQQFVGI